MATPDVVPRFPVEGDTPSLGIEGPRVHVSIVAAVAWFDNGRSRRVRLELAHTHDDAFPRNKAAFGLWVAALEQFLEGRPATDSLRSRASHLLP